MANLPAAIALLHAGLAHLRGDADQMIAFARRAMAECGEGEWMLESLTRWYLAVGEWLAGRLAEAEEALVSSIAGWRAVTHQAPAAAALSYHCLGLVQRGQGRLEAALATYREALAVAGNQNGGIPQVAGVAYVGMAGVFYERGDLDSALKYATDGIPLCRQLVYTPPLATGLVTLARIRQVQGDLVGALDAIGEAERVQISPLIVGLINPVPAERARLALAHGDVDAAARWVRSRGLTAEDQPSYPGEREYQMLVRVLLAEQAPEQALGLLERLHAQAAAQRRTGSLIEVRILQALALSARGNHADALDALSEALAIAAPEGYVRVFVDEGHPMATLLRQLHLARRQKAPAVATASSHHLAHLLDAFHEAGLPVRRGGVTMTGLVEPLSARELEVLQLLAAGATNREIAKQLVVQLDTVKRHVSHLFTKLEVANRTEAVARARELGLLP
jgi:LuxR family maltose regulon positive regulatory protein